MMEALNLLLFILVLQAARAVVLAIWMIVLLIRGGVGRMVDFLLTRFENEVEVPPYEVKLPPVERLQRDRRVHWGRYDGGSIRPENAGLLFFGPVTCVHTRLRTPVEDVPLLHTSKDDEANARREGTGEVDAYKQFKKEGVARDFLTAFSESSASARAMKEGAAEVDAYWQRVREGGKDCHAAFSEISASARAMKEGAAEVDAYWQRVREGGKDCHAAFSECSASTLAHAVIHEERVGSGSRRSARIAARSAAVEPRQSARIAAGSVAIDSSSLRCSSRRVPLATSRLNVGSHLRRSARIAARLI